jgi:hypothetical protein
MHFMVLSERRHSHGYLLDYLPTQSDILQIRQLSFNMEESSAHQQLNHALAAQTQT